MFMWFRFAIILWFKKNNITMSEAKPYNHDFFLK